ncbi:hypothetical protein [Desulfosarcina sp.]|uniref:hypothetical protein n=1 Tax=Desulfosarcina sp. TaxID=2027861 RepID=UPI003970942E
MIDDIEVPSEQMGSFKRVLRRIPVDLKKDEALIKTVVDYLQLGGEKLARQAVEAAKQTYELEVAQRRKKAREDALVRAAEARLAETDEETAKSGDDFDEDEADDDMKDF